MEHQLEPSNLERIKEILCRRFSVVRQLPGVRPSFFTDDNGIKSVAKPLDEQFLSTAACLQMEQETEILRESPPMLGCALAHVESMDQQRFLLRPFLVGKTLQEALSAGRLPPAKALRVVQRVLEALGTLHHMGALHRNVKPTNILLTNDAENPVILLDMGWDDGAVANTTLSSRRPAVNSYAFMAPEQSGALDYDVGEWSDLYAVGAVLFECLTGRRLIQAEDVGAALRRHMTVRVPPLSTLGVKAPRLVDEFMQRLLSKDPRQRYQSTQGAWIDARALAEAAEAQTDNGALVLGLDDRRTTLADPAFVGREREMRLLGEQMSQAQQGDSMLTLLLAESGAGKSRLLNEFAHATHRQGAWVLRGQGVRRESQRPFQMFEGIVHQCAAAAAQSGHEAQRLREALSEDAEIVAEFMPMLAMALGWSEPRKQIEAFGEQRSIRAFAALLRALGSSARPALILLDDCQWADGLTFESLRAWRKGRDDGNPQNSLVVAAFRSEETPEALLESVPADEHLRLAALRPHAVRSMLESMAGPLPHAAVEQVTKLSEGSPLIATAILRGLVESGALRPERDGWRADAELLQSAQPSGEAAAILARRIELLPPPTYQLLTRAAILGKQFDLRFAAFLAGQTLSEALAALHEARRRRLVWMRKGVVQCAFLHDRIRDAFLASMDDGQRRDLHRRAAFRFQEESSQNVFELAYHFDAGGKSEYALEYALRAAEQARAQHALETAEQQYRIAQRGAERADRSTRYTIALGLGEVLMLQGRYDSAASLLEEAAQLAQGRSAEATALCKLGELAAKRGDMEDATQRYEQALRQLGRFIPRSLGALTASLVWNLVVQAAHSLAPTLLVARRKQPPSEEQRLSWWLLSRLAISYWFVRGKLHALWANIMNINLAEPYAPSFELALGYSAHAPAMSLVGWFSRGARYAQKSLQINRDLGDLWGQGQSLHFYGVLHYARAEYAQCIERCREAVRLLEQTGDYWEVHIARYQVAASLYRLGELAAAVEESKQVHQSGLDLGDEQASGIILDVWSRAANGDIPASVVRAELDRERHDAQGIAQVLLAEGVRLIAHDELEAAEDTFRKAIRVAEGARVFNSWVAPNYAWLATALRMQAEQTSLYMPQRRRRLAQQAEKAARKAYRIARQFRTDLPQALRERGRIAALRSQYRRARRWLDRSIAEARSQKAANELSQTLAVRESLGRDMGWDAAPKGAADVNALRVRRSAQAGRKTTISLVDRFAAALECGRSMAATLDVTNVFREAQSAMERLLRCDRCFVAPLDHEMKPRLQANSNVRLGRVEFDRIRATIAAGESQVFADSPDESEPSASAICAPIFVRGRQAACLYAENRELRGVYGEDERRLAEFITAIAGAAMENAEGFEQMQQLNATLEDRVAERTRAAEARARELAVSNDRLERAAAELREAEEQLRMAKDAAERASHAKSGFLATMSHEIRTPMNGITGMTELLMGSPVDDVQRGYLRNVKQSAHFLMELLNDILDLSKIEAGALELEAVEFDLYEMLADASQTLAASAYGKSVELLLDIHPDTPERIVGDPGRLRQVVINLINNAIKFTDRGEIVVEARPVEGVTLDAEATPCQKLTFRVRDTGIGIAPDKQAAIFDAFRQADSSTTRRYGGTGLGLAISSQLVQIMGGSIQVASAVGEGSQFFFTLPFQLVGSTSRPRCRNARRALIIDDNATTRRLCERWLAQWDVQAVSVSSVAAGVRELRGEPAFDVVLVDAMLTVDGVVTAAAAVRRAASPDCRVVVMNPAAQAPLQPDGSTALMKPLRVRDLFQALDRSPRQDPEPESVASDASEDAVRYRILLVEDGQINRDVAVGLLELYGHWVEAVINGRQAIAAYEPERFDAILMDLEMPEMDGFEAARAIRQRELQSNAPRTPIIAMSAHALSNIRDACVDSGMDGFVSKPVDPPELIDVLKRLIKSHSEPIKHE